MNSVANWKIQLTKKARTKGVKNFQGRNEQEKEVTPLHTLFCQKHHKTYVTDESHINEPQRIINNTKSKNAKPTYRQHTQEIEANTKVNAA